MKITFPGGRKGDPDILPFGIDRCCYQYCSNITISQNNYSKPEDGNVHVNKFQDGLCL